MAHLPHDPIPCECKRAPSARRRRLVQQFRVKALRSEVKVVQQRRGGALATDARADSGMQPGEEHPQIKGDRDGGEEKGSIGTQMARRSTTVRVAEMPGSPSYERPRYEYT